MRSEVRAHPHPLLREGLFSKQMENHENALQLGIAAFKAGDKEKARFYFLRAVRQEPNNEQAWGWLSNTTVITKERIYCLQQVVKINPLNTSAKKLLQDLETNEGARIAQPTTDQTPITITQTVVQSKGKILPPTNTPADHYILPDLCPYCKSPVNAGAIVCSNCGRNISPQAIRSEQQIQKFTALKHAGNAMSNLGCLLTIGGIAILACILIPLFSFLTSK